jgi:hypothetical protein
VWAFSDESERGGTMLLSVLMIEPGAVEVARRTMRNLLLSGERRVHTAKESPPRRRVLLEAVGHLEGTSSVVLRLRRAPGVERRRARHLLLQAATGLALASGVATWTLDDQDPAQRSRDRASIAQALAGVDAHLRPTYDHRPSHGEPLLWAADAICWAVGAGGDWRRRVDHLVAVQDLGP